MARKKTITKKWKSIRVPEAAHSKVLEFARRNRLGIADAYDVIVSSFARKNPEEQSSEIVVDTAAT